MCSHEESDETESEQINDMISKCQKLRFVTTPVAILRIPLYDKKHRNGAALNTSGCGTDLICF